MSRFPPPKSEETQHGHMRVQRQGFLSTKPVEPAKALSEGKKKHEKRNDILISSYDMKKTMYTDQTYKFPHRSSQGNEYRIIIHYIDSNSKWIEPIKDRTEEEIILGCAWALKCMKMCGIVPKHQVLYNELYSLYHMMTINTIL